MSPESMTGGALSFGLQLLAETATAHDSLLGRLDPRDRLRVVAALGIILVATGFLVIFIRAAGRLARSYMNRHPRPTRMQGDPFQQVIDSKPRSWQRESQNWQRR